MSADDFKPFPGFATDALHAGQDPEQWKAKCVVPPIAMSTTYKQKSPGQHEVRHDIDRWSWKWFSCAGLS